MSGDMFKLGGGIQGFQPKLLGGGAGTTGGSGMDGASTRGLARKVLRTGFGRFGKEEWSEGFRLDIEGRPENGEYFRVDESDPLVVDWLAVFAGGGTGGAQLAFYKSENFLAVILHNVLAPFKFPGTVFYTFEAGSSNPSTSLNTRTPSTAISDIFNTSFKNLSLATSNGFTGTPTSQVFYQLDKNESITPFRQAYNAGDPNGYINQSSTGGESNHLNSVGLSSSLRVYARSGGVKFNGKATFAGNPKFVYAGDDYVRFKKLAAINKTYNDKSFGGDESNASFTSLMSNY